MPKTGKTSSGKRMGKRSLPKYLGIKIFDGQRVKKGGIIVRQRGTKFIPGKNTKLAKDYSIFALKDGIVKITKKKKISFDGSKKLVRVVSVI
jgi:large subunit ribosomal protein L27